MQEIAFRNPKNPKLSGGTCLRTPPRGLTFCTRGNYSQIMLNPPLGELKVQIRHIVRLKLFRWCPAGHAPGEIHMPRSHPSPQVPPPRSHPSPQVPPLPMLNWCLNVSFKTTLRYCFSKILYKLFSCYMHVTWSCFDNVTTVALLFASVRWKVAWHILLH